MTRRLNMVLLVAIAITALLLQSSMAQTTYVVGDALGWVVPPNGAVAYTTWAANKTFVVGDILVFNFASGRHDVAEVTKANFDACNTNSPISSAINSPANITLNATGEHHYICTFAGHCSGGQKLAINVSTASSSPPPQPSIPSPFPVPAPAPQPRTPSPVSVPAPVPQPRIPSPVPVLAPTPSTSAPTPSPTALPPSTPTATPPSTSTIPSSPSPKSVSTPPTPPNSATSLGVAGLSATLSSIVVASILY